MNSSVSYMYTLLSRFFITIAAAVMNEDSQASWTISKNCNSL